MLIANEMEKNLKDLKKIISADQKDTKHQEDYKNWKLYGEGIPTRNNPYFDETDFEQHELNLRGAKARRAINTAKRNAQNPDYKIRQSGQGSQDWNHIETLRQTNDIKTA